jgi:hypothetical protein
MEKPSFPALVALLVLWVVVGFPATAIYLIHRAFTSKPDPASVVNASTIAPIFGDPEGAIGPPKRVKRPTLATMLEAEAIA